MKKVKLIETQIVPFLKQSDTGFSVRNLCRLAGISPVTHHQSRDGAWMRRIFKQVKELDAENTRLKQVYAELPLDNTPIKDLIAKKAAGSTQKREAGWDLVEVHARPLPRSCGCVGMSRSTWRAPPLDCTMRMPNSLRPKACATKLTA